MSPVAYAETLTPLPHICLGAGDAVQRRGAVPAGRARVGLGLGASTAHAAYSSDIVPGQDDIRPAPSDKSVEVICSRFPPLFGLLCVTSWGRIWKVARTAHAADSGGIVHGQNDIGPAPSGKSVEVL